MSDSINYQLSLVSAFYELSGVKDDEDGPDVVVGATNLKECLKAQDLETDQDFIGTTFEKCVEKDNDNAKIIPSTVPSTVTPKSLAIKRVECELLMYDKTVIYITTHGEKLLKIDCGHTTNVLDKAKFIVGSEIKEHHLPSIVLLDYDDMEYHVSESDNVEKKPVTRHESLTPNENNDHVTSKLKNLEETRSRQENVILHQLNELYKSEDPYAVTGLRDNDPKFHVHEFVEIFEYCCSSVEVHDEYRIQFHLFILRHRLLALELLLRFGVKEHVYKPKQAYQIDGVTRFSIEAEPLSVLQAMLDLFRTFDLKQVDMGDLFTPEQFDRWCNFLQNRLDKVHDLR